MLPNQPTFAAAGAGGVDAASSRAPPPWMPLPMPPHQLQQPLQPQQPRVAGASRQGLGPAAAAAAPAAPPPALPYAAPMVSAGARPPAAPGPASAGGSPASAARRYRERRRGQTPGSQGGVGSQGQGQEAGGPRQVTRDGWVSESGLRRGARSAGGQGGTGEGAVGGGGVQGRAPLSAGAQPLPQQLQQQGRAGASDSWAHVLYGESGVQAKSAAYGGVPGTR